jgi:hypothetical protein
VKDYESKIGTNYGDVSRFDHMNDNLNDRNVMIKKLIVSKKEVDYLE